jgi:hypothetical protein
MGCVYALGIVAYQTTAILISCFIMIIQYFIIVATENLALLARAFVIVHLCLYKFDAVNYSALGHSLKTWCLEYCDFIFPSQFFFKGFILKYTYVLNIERVSFSGSDM